MNMMRVALVLCTENAFNFAVERTSFYNIFYDDDDEIADCLNLYEMVLISLCASVWRPIKFVDALSFDV